MGTKRLNPKTLLEHKWLNLKGTTSARNLFDAKGYDRRFKRFVILAKLQRGVDTILFLNRLKRAAQMLASESGRNDIKLKGINDIQKDLADELERDEKAADLDIY